MFILESMNSPSDRSQSKPACAAWAVSASFFSPPSFAHPNSPCSHPADRRPIDPPPIIQLRVIDKRTRQPPTHPEADDGDLHYAHSFLQNPYYFMFASLAKPDDDAELHWLKDGKTRCTTGSVVSSLYHLKDTENRNEDAGFFVFPDLSVRTEGSYRLKLSLFEVVGNIVRHCKSIYSIPFYVYTAKKFPGMEESTPLSCSLADQGIKIRIRKDIRVRKRPIASLAAPIDGDKIEENQDDEHGKAIAPANGPGKRPRHGTINNPMTLNTSVHAGDLTTPPSANSGTLSGLPPWPTTTTLDPMLGVASAPGGIELPSPAHSGTPPSASSIPPPPGATYELPKVPPANIPPPPGAHIMAPQTIAYDGSGTRQQVAAQSSTSHTRQVQPLATSYQSTNTSQNISPTGPPVSQQAVFTNTPTQRAVYDPPPRQGYDQTSSRAYDTRGYDQTSSRAFDQTSSRTYEQSSSRAYDQTPSRGYDQTSSRTAYEGSHRSGFDPNAAAAGAARSATYDTHAHQQQRSSFENPRPSSTFGQTYVSDTATTSGSYHHPDTSSHPHHAQPHSGYGHPSDAGYVGTQQQHTQPSPTHGYPQQQASSSQQHPQSHSHPLPNVHPNVHTHPGTHSHTHTHESQYSSHPSTAPSRFPNQFGASTIPGFGHSQSQTGYASSHYSSQHQQHQSGANVGGGTGSYYESSQSHPSTHQGEGSTAQQQGYFGAGPSTHHPQLNPNHNHASGVTSSPSSWGPQSSTYDYGEFYTHPGTSTGSQTTRSESTPPAHGPGPSPTSVGARYGSASAQAGAPPTQTVYGGHPHGHSHLVHSPFGPNATTSSYTNTGLSSSANATHEWPTTAGNQGQGPARPLSNANVNNMIHLAPLRHVAHAGGSSASPTPSSPGAGGFRGTGTSGYPSLVPHSHPHAQVHASQVHGHGHGSGIPFEHEGGGRGVPSGTVGSGGKKSVLSIGSIISEGG
ncbi:velvet factor-domain-containing protein [Pisolithus orientalis]|uniref:velvet factor-domain-containing protein n=1 Tax=Pisolithus orientalis TaxID=936130 RepID=UPI00222499A1|nr:velvet factor-domain-containing protein [Pisolithus orientalis]KAI6006182.1 velvet factor-domain-containing protein [Pisolithus orientalis]